MFNPKSPATVDNVLAIATDLLKQVQVLVSAVDDLRAEIEWRSRYPLTGSPCDGPKEGCRASNGETQAGESARSEVDIESVTAMLAQEGPQLPTQAATGENATTFGELLLREEHRLTAAPASPWAEDWDDLELCELPIGLAVVVDEDRWLRLLHLPPAHVIGHDDCCCETGAGAPFLLAWQEGSKYFVRELTDAKARRLQYCCLTQLAARFVPSPTSLPAMAQRALF